MYNLSYKFLTDIYASHCTKYVVHWVSDRPWEEFVNSILFTSLIDRFVRSRVFHAPLNFFLSFKKLKRDNTRPQNTLIYRTRLGFLSKNIFWTYALWCVWPKFIHVHIVKIDKIHSNAPILGCFKECGYNSRGNFNGAGTVARYVVIDQDPWILSLINSKSCTW